MNLKEKKPFNLFSTKFYDNLEKNRCCCGAWLLYRYIDYIDVFRKICMENNQSKKKEEQPFRLRMQTDGKINVDKPPKCVCCFDRALYSQFNLLFTFVNRSEIAFCLRRQILK